MDDTAAPTPIPVPDAPKPRLARDVNPGDPEDIAAHKEIAANGYTLAIANKYPFLKAMHPGGDWK